MDKKDCGDEEKRHCCKSGKDCEGNCGNPACNCPTNNTNFTIPVSDYQTLAKRIYRKQIFYHKKSNYTSGFLSIWLPPKIGYFIALEINNL